GDAKLAGERWIVGDLPGSAHDLRDAHPCAGQPSPGYLDGRYQPLAKFEQRHAEVFELFGQLGVRQRFGETGDLRHLVVEQPAHTIDVVDRVVDPSASRYLARVAPPRLVVAPPRPVHA